MSELNGTLPPQYITMDCRTATPNCGAEPLQFPRTCVNTKRRKIASMFTMIKHGQPVSRLQVTMGRSERLLTIGSQPGSARAGTSGSFRPPSKPVTAAPCLYVFRGE